MKVIIFGATGGIGKHAVKHALDAGYEVVAYVRSPEKMTVIDDRLTVVKGELNEYEKIEKAMAGCDAVISTIGVPMKFAYKEMNSLKAHENIVKAMEENNVTRLIDWATPSIHFKEDKKSVITVVPGIMASILFKKSKEELVKISEVITDSNLDWTIVRFMAPKNSPFTGDVKVGFGDKKMSFNISRSDIAKFMVDQIASQEYVKSMPIIGS